MKNIILLTIGLLLMYSGNISSKVVDAKSNSPAGNSISISSTPELFALTTSWAREYCKLNPEVKITVIKASDATNIGPGLSFVTGDSPVLLRHESAWNIVVGHDAIVPIINAKNPFLAEIYQQGISPAALTKIFKSDNQANWGDLLGKGQTAPVLYYVINSESVKTSVGSFLNLNLDKQGGIRNVENGQQMVQAIQNDPYAIGFCRMGDILDMNSQSLAENIKLLPIDKNGNGVLDYKEKIYDNLSSFFRGVWIGKYPKALCGNIYTIAGMKPTNANEVAFLKWVLNDGQQYLNSNGYYDLVYNERQATIDQFVNPQLPVNTPKNKNAMTKIVLLILAGFLVAGFLVDALVRYFMHRKTRVPDAKAILPYVFNEKSIDVPKGLYFDKTHTWAFMEKEGLVKIGIDDFLQHITGPLTQVKMKNTGEKVKRGEQLVTIIQKGKQLNIKAPVTGTIMAQNKNLIEDSSIINTSPYLDGWVYMIEPTNWVRETQFLNMAEKHREWLQHEFSRLKDFLVVSVKPNTLAYAHIVLQDGGELNDCILEDLGPEVWEDFQTKFMDTTR